MLDEMPSVFTMDLFSIKLELEIYQLDFIYVQAYVAKDRNSFRIQYRCTFIKKLTVRVGVKEDSCQCKTRCAHLPLFILYIETIYGIRADLYFVYYILFLFAGYFQC